MRKTIAFGLALAAAACDPPTGPDRAPRMELTASSPASGSTVVVPAAFPYILPGGVAILPGSGLLSFRLSFASGAEVPWARLSVYLLENGSTSEYCGQNDPDAPTWEHLPADWTSTYAVTGFRVSRLPCDVTGILAVLHTRNTGLMTPPRPEETLAQAVVPLSLRLRREGAVAP